MHIIIDATTTQDQLAYAGPGQYTKNIILALVKGYPSTQYSILLFNDKESTLDKEISQYKNAQVIRVGKYRLNDYKNDIWYYLNILPKIKEIKKENSIFFSPYFWRNFPSDIMPTVLFIHDMNLPMFSMYSQISPIHNLIRAVQYWMTMYKSLKCKYLLCNSETTKTDYLKYYPQYPQENISVSYLGVDVEEKEYPLENILPSDCKERGYLIYLGGGINKSKNSIGVINGYISFLKLLKKENPPYLIIAGGKFQNKRQKEVKELYDAIEKNNIENNVVFTGFYPDESAYSLLKNSFAFIHLSLYEGFGLSVASALRSKTPTILHNNPVYVELFKDVSIIVNGENAEDTGKAIYDVYTNPEKYDDMVRKGYDLSMEYTWERTAKKTYEVFEKLSKKV
ncbi:MAG: glycosyltransferase family 4 protein [Candidatus Dojkabacteria bacterium]